jgi:hypothetical protein
MVCDYKSVKQQMQTIRQNHNNVLIRKVLQVSGLIGLKHQGMYSSMKVIKPFYYLQCAVDLSYIRQCVIYCR